MGGRIRRNTDLHSTFPTIKFNIRASKKQWKNQSRLLVYSNNIYFYFLWILTCLCEVWECSKCLCSLFIGALPLFISPTTQIGCRLNSLSSICFMLILFVCLFWDTLFPIKVGHSCFKGFWKIFREAWKGELLQILLHFLRIEVVVGAFLKSIHQIAQRLPLNICRAKWSFSPTTYLWSIWAIMPGHWTPSIDKCVINWYWKCNENVKKASFWSFWFEVIIFL